MFHSYQISKEGGGQVPPLPMASDAYDISLKNTVHFDNISGLVAT